MTDESGIDFPWLRRIRVEFSGLHGGREKALVSTGKQDSLRISVKVQKPMVGISTAHIMLHNLDRDTRRSFVRNDTMVRVFAGWDHGPTPGLNQCFYGELLAVESRRSGPDIVTTIKSIPGARGMAEANVRKTWRPNTAVKDIVKELAGMIAKVTVDPSRIVGIRHKVGESGWTWSGSAKDALEAAGKEFGFSQAIIDQVFQAIDDQESLGKPVEVKDPYLIDVNPVLATPLQTKRGVSWRCTFNPAIAPGQDINLTSQLASDHDDFAPGYQVNGRYTVNMVNHDLDCFTKHSFITTGMAYSWGNSNG